MGDSSKLVLFLTAAVLWLLHGSSDAVRGLSVVAISASKSTRTSGWVSGPIVVTATTWTNRSSRMRDTCSAMETSSAAKRERERYGERMALPSARRGDIGDPLADEGRLLP